ncbi:MAG: adenylate kinase [Muricomes sp.]|uniref:hypothetical protein n=1 Tax=Faecalicatena contorta TaxID=39482 RepID=UPI002EC8B27A|nr:adenylate kinase [Muricomes sp.]
MSKKLNIKDLKKEILKDAAKQISKDGCEIKCPKCNTKFTAHGGENTCPECGSSIDFSINIKP